MSNCCHLHCHSSYSFADGLTPPEELVEKAVMLGQPGLAITDHGHLFGAASFFKACKKHGLQGVIGMEAYEAVPHTWDPEKHSALFKGKWTPDAPPRYHHLTLWASNETGWRNLCALHSLSYTADYKPKNQPLIDRAALERHNEGLLVGLGCIASRFNQALIRDGEEAAYQAAKWVAEVFGDRAYCEVMGNLPDQIALIHSQRRIAKRLGLLTLATNDVHYRDREDGVEHGTHHSLVQARRWKRKTGTEESDDKSDAGYGRWYGSDQFYLKSYEEFVATSGIQREEVDRTLEVLDRVEFDFYSLERPAPPVAPVPEPGQDEAFDRWLSLR